MFLTIEQIDAKIKEAEQNLEFFKKAREVVANPLFAQLTAKPPGIMVPTRPQQELYPILNGADFVPRRYGELKRLVLECLPYVGPLTPQELSERIIETGYVFKTRTPSISVNDTLKTLEKEGLVRLTGKSTSNAGLWLRKSLQEQTEEKILESQ